MPQTKKKVRLPVSGKCPLERIGAIDLPWNAETVIDIENLMHSEFENMVTESPVQIVIPLVMASMIQSVAVVRCGGGDGNAEVGHGTDSSCSGNTPNATVTDNGGVGKRCVMGQIHVCDAEAELVISVEN